MEIGNIEGMIAVILEHYIAHFDLQQKIDHLFFHEICTVWRVNALVHSVKVSNQGAVKFFKCPIPQCFKNKGELCHILLINCSKYKDG